MGGSSRSSDPDEPMPRSPGPGRAAAGEREETRFGEHERDDAPSPKPSVFNRELAGAFARRLRRGVAGHHQDREQHGAGNGQHDRADIADLVG